MTFYEYIARPTVVLATVSELVARGRQRLQPTRHPGFPLPSEHRTEVKLPPTPKIPRSSVAQYSIELAREGRVLRIDPSGFSRVFGLTRSLREAAEALLG